MNRHNQKMMHMRQSSNKGEIVKKYMLLFIIGFTLTLPGSSLAQETNQLPIALCLSDVTTATIDQRILFNGTSSFDNDGNIISYHWNFGDNTASNLSSVTHSYTKEGEYPVTLTVTDDDNARTTCQTTVTIQGIMGELLPAIIAGPITCSVETLCSYTITTPGHIDQMVSYQITWNDTQIHTQTTDPMTPDEPYLFNITWTTAGICSLSVISSTNDSTTDATTVRILVDGISLDDIGYLIDYDADGFYDTFQDLLSSQRNTISYEGDQYLIDTDFDDQWDYTYNQSSGLQQINDQHTNNTIGFEFFLIILGVFFVVFITKKR